ncbi:MAG TPA: DUF5658 family protein [Vicinamibacterales bacterium]|jgi:hypothetical protein|nr:DUF5658 family protein [Vicinamibacterales bacterium]
MIAASALIVAALSAASAGTGATDAPRQEAIAPLAAAVAAAPALATGPEPWMFDRKVRRPAAVSVMYGTLGALQALDVYSTRRALNHGGTEANPLVRPAAGSTAAMSAVKAASTAASIFFAERAWKKNRKGAVVLMAIVNGATAAVVARNLRNAR